MAFSPLGPGVWQILPTPFRGRELEVDHDYLRAVIEHARRSRVTGVVALGVLGEGSRLSSAERAAVLETVIAAAGELPVVAGVPALATAPAAEDAKLAAASGACAVMLLIPTGDAARLAQHAAAVSAACGLGIVFQDHPATTGVSITPVALTRAIGESGVGVAIKAEAPPTPATIAVTAPETGLPVFGGLGGVGLLDELAAGAAGAMTGFAFPEVLVDTVAAFSASGFGAAKTALEPFLPLMVFEAQVPVSLAIRKELLRRRGLIDEAGVRSPGASFPGWAAALLSAHLDGLPDDVSVLQPRARSEVGVE
jgi:4-hydroxy-tetrahydrodipicolinate synthase